MAKNFPGFKIPLNATLVLSHNDDLCRSPYTGDPWMHKAQSAGHSSQTSGGQACPAIVTTVQELV